MARKEKRNVRFDNRHVRLKTGETQKKNGYEYRWTTKDGKRHSIPFSQQRWMRCERWRRILLPISMMASKQTLKV